MPSHQSTSIELVRSAERWNLPVHEYTDLASFLCERSFPKGIHSIQINGSYIDMLIDIKPAASIVFMLNGAMDRSREPPFFYGGGVIPKWCSRVSINDPSLYSSRTLTLGWYAGTEHIRLQSMLPEIISKLLAVSKSDRPIFSGGSGGGFAALYYSAGIFDAIAMVWNPQSDILKYIQGPVKAYANAAFGMSDWSEVAQKLSEIVEVDVCKVYRSGFVNKVVYLQNSRDWHVEKHCFPFLDALSIARPADTSGVISSERIILRFGNWGEGHAAPPPALTGKVLEVLASSGFDGLIKAGDEPFV